MGDIQLLNLKENNVILPKYRSFKGKKKSSDTHTPGTKKQLSSLKPYEFNDRSFQHETQSNSVRNTPYGLNRKAQSVKSAVKKQPPKNEHNSLMKLNTFHRDFQRKQRMKEIEHEEDIPDGGSLMSKSGDGGDINPLDPTSFDAEMLNSIQQMEEKMQAYEKKPGGEKKYKLTRKDVIELGDKFAEKRFPGNKNSQMHSKYKELV